MLPHTCPRLSASRRENPAWRELPQGLLRALRADGFTADHIITLGWRGLPDAVIRQCMQGAEVVFVTQDAEFLVAQVSEFALVVVSRVRQSRPIADRVAIWHRAARELLATPQTGRFFELSDDGVLICAAKSSS